MLLCHTVCHFFAGTKHFKAATAAYISWISPGLWCFLYNNTAFRYFILLQNTWNRENIKDFIWKPKQQKKKILILSEQFKDDQSSIGPRPTYTMDTSSLWEHKNWPFKAEARWHTPNYTFLTQNRFLKVKYTVYWRVSYMSRVVDRPYYASPVVINSQQLKLQHPSRSHSSFQQTCQTLVCEFNNYIWNR